MKTSQKKSKLVTIITATVATLGVAAVLYGVAFSTGLIQKNATALTVGDHKIDSIEYRYYYTNAKANLINQYGSYMAQNGVDLNKPLEKQNYTEDQTWGEYLHNSATAELGEVYAFYQEAKNANYQITEAIQIELDASIAAFESAAKDASQDTETYVKSIYGKNMSFDKFKEILTNRYYAIGYIRDTQSSTEVTEEDIQKYYEENPNKLEVVDYNFFSIPFETVEGDEAKTLENKENAKKLAEEMIAKVTTPSSFADLAHEYAPAEKKPYYADKTVTYINGGAIAEDAGPISEWVIDPARVTGDKTVIEGEKEHTAVLFTRKYLDEYKSVSVRHILIMPETADTHTHEGDAPHSDDEFDADAKKKAQEVLASYLSGDKTEDSFAALAKEHSQDTASVPDGGLYKDFIKNTMVAEFEDWSFDPARKAGDTEIVKTDYGYHIMYFVGEGTEGWKVKASDTIKEERFNKFFEETVAKYENKLHKFGASMAY